ncbi:MAG TPA: hypothetical protein VEH50_01820 [Methylomirabilota bacterium]|nr:hypothetical protein [Methylomirabilota bacterium]
MYHYDAKTALEELNEDALLPHPVRVRDMMLRTQLGADDALDVNREFQNYLTHFGEAQQIARAILEKLASGVPKRS